jgi:hypothetical protein
MSCHQTAGQNRAANKSFQNVETFKYLRVPVTHQNCIQGALRSRLNLWATCHRSSGALSSQLRVGVCWLDSSGSRQGPVAGSCGHSDGSFGFLKKRGISWVTGPVPASRQQPPFAVFSGYSVHHVTHVGSTAPAPCSPIALQVLLRNLCSCLRVRGLNLGWDCLRREGKIASFLNMALGKVVGTVKLWASFGVHSPSSRAPPPRSQRPLTLLPAYECRCTSLTQSVAACLLSCRVLV